MVHRRRLAVMIHVAVVLCICCRLSSTSHKRHHRELPLLFYRNTSVVQFISGFGIPVQDLELESVTSGMVFRCQQFLPASVYDLTQHTTHAINGRKLHSEDLQTDRVYAQQFHDFFESKQRTLSKYRWTVYQALELLAEHFGYPGRACVLKSICEAAAMPFHYANGLLGELAHIIFTPSTSIDELTTQQDNEYINAEYLGSSGANCEDIFRECPKSVLEKFSYAFDFTRDVDISL